MIPIASFRLPQYPAWVREESVVPRGTPIIVHAQGRVVAGSIPLLHAQGISIGERVERARVLAPHAEFHLRDEALETAHWENVLSLLTDTSPYLLSLRPGWGLIGVVLRERIMLLARSLRAALGIAPNRLAAMIASLQAAPSEVVEVDQRDVARFIARASVHHLVDLDVDQEIVERLRLFGFGTLGDVAGLTRRHLVAQFGKEGKDLFELLHQKEEQPIPVFVPPPVVTARQEIDPPSVEPGDLTPALQELMRMTVKELDPLLAHRVTLRLDGPHPESPRVARRILKAPTSQNRMIAAAADALLRSLLRHDLMTATMTLELGGLSQPTAIQGDLFRERLDLRETVRFLQTRFPGVLYRVALVDRDAILAEESYRRVDG